MAEATLVFTTGCADIEPSELVLVGAQGHEEMSSLYEYELTLECHRAGGLPANLIDGLLTNSCFISMQGGGFIEVHGMLRKIQLLAANEEAPVNYSATLVPHLWSTTRVHRTKIFQEMNVKQIVETVLADHEVDAEWYLDATYPSQEYTVQYEETDFDFMSRLLEHWGIFYFFRQSPDGEVLVIGDAPRVFPELPDYESLTFSPSMGRGDNAGTVNAISNEVETQTAGITVREYNWRIPGIGLAATQAADTASGIGAHWLYGEHFKNPDEGAMIARIRAEQELNRRELYSGICTVPGLAPGHRFLLIGCPLPELNITYLVTSVSPTINIVADSGDEAYQYPFTAVPLERVDPVPVPYRPQCRTTKPVIHGFMHGFVDGEAATTASPIDDNGRYRIVLPMDSTAALGGKATRWIRMMQSSAGNAYGIHFPLHMGTEVLIAHLDGDPDRPVILGAVPNPSTSSPIVQNEATRSRIRTRSGIEFEFEDDA